MDAIRGYGSESSTDDEDTSKQEQETNKEASSKTTKLPSVPAEILSMFEEKTDQRSVDDPKKHQGRNRSFPHVPGNWATYVYVEVPVTNTLATLVDHLTHCLSNHIQVNIVEDIHISLSKTVPLQFHWIEPFICDLKARTRYLQNFSCFLQDLNLYSNDEKTRSFISLEVGFGHEQLEDITHIVDGCLSEFSLPLFYKNPSFHASVAWFLGDYRKVLDTDVTQNLKDCFMEHGKGFEVRVDKLICKSGCKQFMIDLGT